MGKRVTGGCVPVESLTLQVSLEGSTPPELHSAFWTDQAVSGMRCHVKPEVPLVIESVGALGTTVSPVVLKVMTLVPLVACSPKALVTNLLSYCLVGQAKIFGISIVKLKTCFT